MRNPDVLNTIANLSSDEVFTPPEFANRMMDTIEQAWAADNEGEIIWSREDVTFLDPATKSGVFLREIVSRLIKHQGDPPRDSEDRKALVDRILTQQVFGIGMTALTSMISRRSVYCSKDARSVHSVARTFANDWGNIWFQRTEHTWINRRTEWITSADGQDVEADLARSGRCFYCNVAESEYERGPDAESYAYAFIHADDPKALVNNLFGRNMHFDVVIGNPPYQMGAAPGADPDAERNAGRLRDIPVYHRFVAAAKDLAPRYVSMVIPSRWMAGGLGLKDFRAEMLADRRLRALVDFPASAEVFPGVDISGGICYFLWDSAADGHAEVTTVRGDEHAIAVRDLAEFDVFVRDSRAAEILRKVQAKGEPSITKILSADKEFGWTSNFSGFHDKPRKGDVPLHYNRGGKRLVGYVKRSDVKKSAQLIDKWKVLVPSAGFEHGGGDGRNMRVLSTPLITPSPSVCTQTYIFLWCDSKEEAKSIQSYVVTRFLRFLVSLRKITQHASPSTYTWVPQQTWDRTWTDAELYAKYELTDEEIEYVESVIKPMSVAE
jgi:site-specific DNA-methyltransferase (adenine-specific)